MEVRILRGQNQIGGSIIEVSSKNTKIILDIGLNLGEDKPSIPDVIGLFKGEAIYNAILVSHYHSDHIGLINDVLPSIPIYIGKKAFEIFKFCSEYGNKNEKINREPNFFSPNEEFFIGDMKIKVLLCDHSAFDSYMFLIECEEKKILYTGDFRSNGRKNFEKFLKNLPEVDVLIIEGTALSRDEDKKNLFEKDLETEGKKRLKNFNKPVFVLAPATNIDRIVTFYKIAIDSNRIFLQDTYTASITTIVYDSIPNPKKFPAVKIFQTDNSEKQHKILLQFPENNRIGRSAITKKNFLMYVRSSMLDYLRKLSKEVNFNGGILFYSMWKGYEKEQKMQEFLKFMQEKGVEIFYLHTSGHADKDAIDKLIKTVSPKYIVPVHTENSVWFKKYNNSKIILDKNFISF